MDMAMSWALCKLDAASASALWLRRLAPGRYEVDNRRLTVSWRSPKRADLVVSEDDVPTDEKIPLLDYLRQAARVALFLAHPPATSNDAVAASASFDGGDERVQCMLLACREAGMKEFATGR